MQSSLQHKLDCVNPYFDAGAGRHEPVKDFCRGMLPLGGSLVIGEVLRFHVDDAVCENFRVDPDQLRPIGRMAGNTYTRTTDRFELVRPKLGEQKSG